MLLLPAMNWEGPSRCKGFGHLRYLRQHSICFKTGFLRALHLALRLSRILRKQVLAGLVLLSVGGKTTMRAQSAMYDFLYAIVISNDSRAIFKAYGRLGARNAMKRNQPKKLATTGAHRLCCLQASRTWTLSLSEPFPEVLMTAQTRAVEHVDFACSNLYPFQPTIGLSSCMTS